MFSSHLQIERSNKKQKIEFVVYYYLLTNCKHMYNTEAQNCKNTNDSTHDR